AIQLRFRQRISAVMLYGILRGNHQKGLRQRVGMRIHRDLALVHCLKKGRLRFRRSAVDLIYQQNVGEYGATFELELLLHSRVDRNSNHVGREHIAGELNSLKTAIDCPRQRLTESSLANSWNAFYEQVSAGKNGDQRQPNPVIFAANDFSKGGFELRCSMGGDSGRFWRH